MKVAEVTVADPESDPTKVLPSANLAQLPNPRPPLATDSDGATLLIVVKRDPTG